RGHSAKRCIEPRLPGLGFSLGRARLLVIGVRSDELDPNRRNTVPSADRCRKSSRFSHVDRLVSGKRLHERPQPFSFCDSFGGPMPGGEVAISEATRRAGAQTAVEAATLAASHGSTFAGGTSPRFCSTPP